MNTTALAITVTIVFLAIAVLLGVKIASRNMPIAALKQGYKNLIITLFLVMAGFGIVWLVVFLGFKQSAKNSLLITWLTGFVIIYFLFIIFWFVNRRKAGKALLDVMPFPNKYLFLIIGVLIIILGFSGAYSMFWRESEYSSLISSIIGILLGTYQIFMSFSHIRVYENGILAYVDLVNWEKIESFQWISGHKEAYTLKLKFRGRLPGFMRNGAIPVPIEKKTEVNQLLEKYLTSIISVQNSA